MTDHVGDREALAGAAGPAPESHGAAATTAASVVRGGLWNTAAGLIPHLYTLIVSVVAARVLGSHDFGRQSFIAFAELSVVMLLTGGLPLAVMRSVGERIGAGRAPSIRGLLVRAWSIEALAAVCGGVVLAVVAFAGADPRSAWLLAGVAASMGILHSVPSALLQGAQLWKAAGIVGLVTGAIGTVAVIVVLAEGGGIVGMFAVEAAISVGNLAWTSLLATRALRRISGPVTASGDTRYGDVWRYAGVATIGMLLTYIVWRRSELFFLQRYSSDSEIAFFSIAFAAVTALVRLPDAIGLVALPAAATLFGAGAVERVRAGYSRAIRLALAFVLPLTAGALVLAPPALVLAYGDDYDRSALVLVILLLPFPLLPLMTLASAVLIGSGSMRLPLISTAVAAAVNVGLAAVLVPFYDAVGAAVASSTAQVVGAMLVLVFTARIVRGVSWSPAAALRSAIAAAGTGLAAWGALHLGGGAGGLALGLVAGTAAFAALAVLLRVLPAEDASWLEEAAGDRLGGLIGLAARHCSAR